jgi:hypothetical protein
MAAALLLVLVVAVPPVRATAIEFLRLRGVDIFRTPSVPTATAGAPVSSFSGERMTLDDARRRVRFPLRVPTASELGSPDEVYLETLGSTDRVTLVYRQRAGIPVSPQAGVSAIVVELVGRVDDQLFAKVVGPDTRVEPVAVAGARGFWLEGAPHQFFLRDASGNALPETLRLAGNTIVWEESGVTLRLEAQVDRDTAIRLAASSR